MWLRAIPSLALGAMRAVGVMRDSETGTFPIPFGGVSEPCYGPSRVVCAEARLTTEAGDDGGLPFDWRNGI
jgi:hypothetical protein